jgi:acetylornithine deacetylase
LTDLRRQLERERPPYSEEFAEVPFVALNIGRVAGGQALNVIPAQCTIDLGIRLLPGQAVRDISRSITDCVKYELGNIPFTLEIMGESPPMMVPAHAPIHRLLCAHLGQEESRSAPFASDGGWLRRLDVDCVLLGPGSMDAAHRPNEFLAIDEFVRAGRLLEALVHSTCEIKPDE